MDCSLQFQLSAFSWFTCVSFPAKEKERGSERRNTSKGAKTQGGSTSTTTTTLKILCRIFCQKMSRGCSVYLPPDVL